jgi:hypothetical protein
VQLSLAALDDCAQLGGILNAVVEGFEKNTEKNLQFEMRDQHETAGTHSRCHS